MERIFGDADLRMLEHLHGNGNIMFAYASDEHSLVLYRDQDDVEMSYATPDSGSWGVADLFLIRQLLMSWDTPGIQEARDAFNRMLNRALLSV